MCWKAANLLILSLAVAACAQAPLGHKIKQETVVFGTHVAVTLIDADAARAQAAIAEVFAHFEAMHERFHPWRGGGELQRLNADIADGALPTVVSLPMAAMIEQAQVYSTYSEGLFNPGVGALVRLWGFHADTLPSAPPPPAAVTALVAQGGDIAALEIAGNRVLAAPVALQLDFGAQAKGVGLDEARAILQRRGIRNALINIGGNIMALGKNGDRPWRVGLSPDRRQPPVARVDLHDGEVVATSGGSERYFMHQGRRYHHIIDPRNGYPAQAVAAAAVISAGENAGAISDAAATALVIADDATVKRILPRFNITMAWRVGTAPSPAMQQRMLAGGAGSKVWE